MPATGSAIRAGRAFVEVSLDDTKFINGLNRIRSNITSFGSSIARIGAANLSGAFFGIGIPFAAAAREFAEFDTALRTTASVATKTAEEFQPALVRLESLFRQLGRTTTFTAKEVADAGTQFARGGFDLDEIEAALPDALNLARGTGTDLEETVGILVSTLRQFNIAAGESGRVVDLLAFTANNSNQRLIDVAESFKLVAPLAVAAGQSIEEVAASSAILADRGIKGSIASTALARALKNLSSAQGLKDLREALGNRVTLTDQLGNLRQTSDILEDIFDATQSLGTRERVSIFETVFGRAAAAQIAIAGSVDALRQFKNELGTIDGTAERLRKQIESGIGGSFKLFLSAVTDVGLELIKSLEPSINRIIKGFALLANQASKFIAEYSEVVVQVAGGVTAFVLLNGAILTLGLSLVAIGTSLQLVLNPFRNFQVIAVLIAATFNSSMIPAVLAAVVAFKAYTAVVRAAQVAVRALLAVQAAYTAFQAASNLLALGPILGTVGAILALTAAFVAFRAINVETILAPFRGIGDDFKVAFEGIGRAIAAGDIESALEIVIASTKVLGAQLLAVLRGIISDLIAQLGNDVASVFGLFDFTLFSGDDPFGFKAAGQLAIENARAALRGVIAAIEQEQQDREERQVVIPAEPVEVPPAKIAQDVVEQGFEDVRTAAEITSKTIRDMFKDGIEGLEPLQDALLELKGNLREIEFDGSLQVNLEKASQDLLEAVTELKATEEVVQGFNNEAKKFNAAEADFFEVAAFEGRRAEAQAQADRIPELRDTVERLRAEEDKQKRILAKNTAEIAKEFERRLAIINQGLAEAGVTNILDGANTLPKQIEVIEEQLAFLNAQAEKALALDANLDLTNFNATRKELEKQLAELQREFEQRQEAIANFTIANDPVAALEKSLEDIVQAQDDGAPLEATRNALRKELQNFAGSIRVTDDFGLGNALDAIERAKEKRLINDEDEKVLRKNAFDQNRNRLAALRSVEERIAEERKRLNAASGGFETRVARSSTEAVRLSNFAIAPREERDTKAIRNLARRRNEILNRLNNNLRDLGRI